MINRDEILAKLQAIKQSTQTIIDGGGTNAETSGAVTEDQGQSEQTN